MCTYIRTYTLCTKLLPVLSPYTQCARTSRDPSWSRSGCWPRRPGKLVKTLLAGSLHTCTHVAWRLVSIQQKCKYMYMYTSPCCIYKRKIIPGHSVRTLCKLLGNFSQLLGKCLTPKPYFVHCFIGHHNSSLWVTSWNTAEEDSFRWSWFTP